MKNWMILSVALVAFTGCKNDNYKPEEEAKPVAEKPAEPKVDAAEAEEDLSDQPELAPEEPTTELGDLPIAEDLEEEADRVVLQDNLEAELDRIELELME